VGAGNYVTSCNLRVFADEAAEPLPAQNLHTGHTARCMHASCGQVLLQHPVRPVRIVVIGIFAEDQPQVPLAGDQHPVQALTAGAGDPAFRNGVRPWRPHRCLDDPHVGGSKHRVECRSELGVLCVPKSRPGYATR
jgi:hypothetical protein